MRVLHIMPNIARSFGGPVESLIGYARAAHLQGIDVEVASPKCNIKDLQWLRQQLPDVTFHQFKSWGRHVWVMSRSLWYWLGKNGSQYDVIHIHGLFNPLSSRSAMICRKQEMSYVIRPFGTLSRYTFSRKRWFKEPWFQLIDKPNLEGANGIHFTTKQEYEEAGRLDFDIRKEFVIPPPFKQNDIGDEIVIEKFDVPVCLYMSRLHPKKNIEGLFHAWEKVVQKYPDGRLIVAGSGDEKYEARLKESVQTLELTKSIVFKGFVSGNEKKNLLAKSWIFALPSYHENFGVAVLEAVAKGLPVVITPEVQLSGLVEEYDIGKVVPRNPNRIADAIVELFKDDQYRKTCVKRGAEIAEQEFSIDRIGDDLKRMYYNVINS